MKSKAKLNYKIKILVILLIVLMNSNLISNFINNQSQNGLKDLGSNDIIIDNKENYLQDNKSLNPSEIVYHSNKYNLSDWWNKTFNYRIGLKLEELASVDRYQPVDVYLTFQEDEHYENTTRLVSFNATGNNEWSNPKIKKITTIGIYKCQISYFSNVITNCNICITYQLFVLIYERCQILIIWIVVDGIRNYHTDFWLA